MAMAPNLSQNLGEKNLAKTHEHVLCICECMIIWLHNGDNKHNVHFENVTMVLHITDPADVHAHALAYFIQTFSSDLQNSVLG